MKSSRPLAVEDVAAWLGGEAVGFAPGTQITGFAWDSRDLEPGELFMAIRGVNVDGHNYTGGALKSGAAGSIVEKPIEGPHILVRDLVKALASLATRFRDGFSGPVVGVTGSTGKTITKEFVARALSPLGPILQTEGNRNTEITAPILWTQATPEHRAAVVEMGMRGFGQIAHLASFSKPTIGIITNIGYAHLEQVGSRRGIAKAKGELLEALPRTGGIGVLWQGDLFMDILRPRVKSGVVRTFGFTENADCRIVRYEPHGWREAIVVGELDGAAWEARLPIVGRHIALNAAAAVLAANLAGVDPAKAAEQIGAAQIPPMRMQILELSGATVVMDAYNASPTSVVAAIETMQELGNGKGRRLAVIGEMKELGEATEEAHRMVGRALAQWNVDQTIFVGDATEFCWDEMLQYGASADRFRIAHELGEVTEFLREVGPGDTVLIKGSRALQLEDALLPLQDHLVR